VDEKERRGRVGFAFTNDRNPDAKRLAMMMLLDKLESGSGQDF
jgi:hypothetical protein